MNSCWSLSKTCWWNTCLSCSQVNFWSSFTYCSTDTGIVLMSGASMEDRRVPLMRNSCPFLFWTLCCRISSENCGPRYEPSRVIPLPSFKLMFSWSIYSMFIASLYESSRDHWQILDFQRGLREKVCCLPQLLNLLLQLYMKSEFACRMTSMLKSLHQREARKTRHWSWGKKSSIARKTMWEHELSICIWCESLRPDFHPHQGIFLQGISLRGDWPEILDDRDSCPG